MGYRRASSETRRGLKPEDDVLKTRTLVSGIFRLGVLSSSDEMYDDSIS